MTRGLDKEIKQWEKALKIALERARQCEMMARLPQAGLEAEEARRRAEADVGRIVNRLEELERAAGVEHVRTRRSEWRGIDWVSILVKLWDKDPKTVLACAQDIERALGLPGLVEDVASWPRLPYRGRAE